MVRKNKNKHTKAGHIPFKNPASLKLAVLLILNSVLILGVALLGYSYYLTQKLNQYNALSNRSLIYHISNQRIRDIQPALTISPKSDITPEKSVALKTFEDKRYGFSFSYSDYPGQKFTSEKFDGKDTLRKVSEIRLYFNDSDSLTIITTYLNPKSLTVDQWWEENFNELYKGQVDHINGEPVLRSDFKSNFASFGNNTYFTPKYGKFQGASYFIGNYSYIVNIYTTNRIDIILSSLKFFD